MQTIDVVNGGYTRNFGFTENDTEYILTIIESKDNKTGLYISAELWNGYFTGMPSVVEEKYGVIVNCDIIDNLNEDIMSVMDEKYGKDIREKGFTYEQFMIGVKECFKRYGFPETMSTPDIYLNLLYGGKLYNENTVLINNIINELKYNLHEHQEVDYLIPGLLNAVIVDECKRAAQFENVSITGGILPISLDMTYIVDKYAYEVESSQGKVKILGIYPLFNIPPYGLCYCVGDNICFTTLTFFNTDSIECYAKGTEGNMWFNKLELLKIWKR